MNYRPLKTIPYSGTADDLKNLVSPYYCEGRWTKRGKKRIFRSTNNLKFVFDEQRHRLSIFAQPSIFGYPGEAFGFYEGLQLLAVRAAALGFDFKTEKIQLCRRFGCTDYIGLDDEDDE